MSNFYGRLGELGERLGELGGERRDLYEERLEVFQLCSMLDMEIIPPQKKIT